MKMKIYHQSRGEIMSRVEEIYKPALNNRNIPILTLDNKWHRLFTQANSNQTIKYLEEELNALLKRQGKLNTEINEIKKLKTRLMEEIISIREDLDSKNRKSIDKKLNEHSRLIAECNDKIESYQDELLDLPKEIQEKNQQLMLETMSTCYQTMHGNISKIEEITKWLKAVRVELKKKLVRKQQCEIINQELYHYMHDIFGADIIEIFDMKYQNNDKSKKQDITDEIEYPDKKSTIDT